MIIGARLDEFAAHDQVWVARRGERYYDDGIVVVSVYITLVDAAERSEDRIDFLLAHGFRKSPSSAHTSPSYELGYSDAVLLMSVLDAWIVVDRMRQ